MCKGHASADAMMMEGVDDLDGGSLLTFQNDCFFSE